MEYEQDPHSVTYAMCVAAVLAVCKNTNVIPIYVKWHLNAYTNWNLLLILIRSIFSLHQWDPFLCLNSMGIYVSFKTAFSQKLDDNIRHKLNKMGFIQLSRLQFVIADFIVHALPALVFIPYMIHKRKKIPFVTVTYALTLSTWFAFRQAGKLDASQVYVPHPWKRAWFAMIFTCLNTRFFVNSAIGKEKNKAFFYLLLMVSPILTTCLDKKNMSKYKFEYIRQCKQEEDELKTNHMKASLSTGSLTHV